MVWKRFILQHFQRTIPTVRGIIKWNPVMQNRRLTSQWNSYSNTFLFSHVRCIKGWIEIVCARVYFVFPSKMLVVSQIQKATNRLMRYIIHFNKTQASSASNIFHSQRGVTQFSTVQWKTMDTGHTSHIHWKQWWIDELHNINDRLQNRL